MESTALLSDITIGQIWQSVESRLRVLQNKKYIAFGWFANNTWKSTDFRSQVFNTYPLLIEDMSQW